MEYISPANHVFVNYSRAQLIVLSIRSHVDGQTLFATRLKKFLLQNNFPVMIDHLVSFETIPAHVTHQQLLQDTFEQTYGEGYVVEIIQEDRPSYLVKIKTKKYFMIYGDGGNVNSPRSLFEALLNENIDDLRMIFKDDLEALMRIDTMEQNIRPKYNQIINYIEKFYRDNKHLSKQEFLKSIKVNENMKIYQPLLLRLYAGKKNDYRIFAMKHAKDLFDIGAFGNQMTNMIIQNKLE